MQRDAQDGNIDRGVGKLHDGGQAAAVGQHDGDRVGRPAALCTTWALVITRPCESKMTPEPVPWGTVSRRVLEAGRGVWGLRPRRLGRSA